MTRQIRVGGVPVGGGAPVTIQSMTNTPTQDAAATVAQIRRLEQAGCEIVRVAVPNLDAARAVGAIKAAIAIPLVVDIHFDYKLALECVRQGCDAVRINPGNIGSAEKVRAVAQACRERGLPIRVGVNGGSLEKPLLARYGGVTPEALVESAFGHIRLLEDCGFEDICVSLKSSSVPVTMRAYQLMSGKSDYPLHIGVTETGTLRMGTLKSAVGIGGLLALGIGDTVRVSLSADPVEEVYAARDILRAGAGLLPHLRPDEGGPDLPGPGGGGAAQGRGQAHHGGRHGLRRQRPRGGRRRRRGHCRGRGRGPSLPKRGDREKGSPGRAGGRAV